MRHKRSVDKARRMKRRKDSIPDEQDVRNDRTREAKTLQSLRNKCEKKNIRKIGKKEENGKREILERKTK